MLGPTVGTRRHGLRSRREPARGGAAGPARLRGSIPLFEEAVAVLSARLGADHPYTASAKFNFALLAPLRRPARSGRRPLPGGAAGDRGLVRRRTTRRWRRCSTTTPTCCRAGRRARRGRDAATARAVDLDRVARPAALDAGELGPQQSRSGGARARQPRRRSRLLPAIGGDRRGGVRPRSRRRGDPAQEPRRGAARPRRQRRGRRADGAGRLAIRERVYGCGPLLRRVESSARSRRFSCAVGHHGGRSRCSGAPPRSAATTPTTGTDEMTRRGSSRPDAWPRSAGRRRRAPCSPPSGRPADEEGQAWIDAALAELAPLDDHTQPS